MPSFTHRLAIEVLQASNRLLPAPALPGDVVDLEYAQWEYETSDTALALWEREAAVPRRALDVGCGLGGKTLRLAESNRGETEWWALDISGEHLAGARRFEAHRGGANRIHWLQGDAARLPFSDGSFDRIITADALEHFPQPKQSLRELRRCLSQDGRLVLLFNPWYSPRGSHLGDVLRLPWCQAFFSREVLAAATRRILQRRAEREPDPRLAARLQAQADDLVDHFEHHLHRTTIADLRRWLHEDRTFVIEHEIRVGPGRLAHIDRFPPRWLEEWWSATYGAVLAPRTDEA